MCESSACANSGRCRLRCRAARQSAGRLLQGQSPSDPENEGPTVLQTSTVPLPWKSDGGWLETEQRPAHSNLDRFGSLSLSVNRKFRTSRSYRACGVSFPARTCWLRSDLDGATNLLDRTLRLGFFVFLRFVVSTQNQNKWALSGPCRA